MNNQIGLYQTVAGWCRGLDDRVVGVVKDKLVSAEIEYDAVEVERCYVERRGDSFSLDDPHGYTWEVTVWVKWGHPQGRRKEKPANWEERVHAFFRPMQLLMEHTRVRHGAGGQGHESGLTFLLRIEKAWKFVPPEEA